MRDILKARQRRTTSRTCRLVPPLKQVIAGRRARAHGETGGDVEALFSSLLSAGEVAAAAAVAVRA